MNLCDVDSEPSDLHQETVDDPAVPSVSRIDTDSCNTKTKGNKRTGVTGDNEKPETKKSRTRKSTTGMIKSLGYPKPNLHLLCTRSREFSVFLNILIHHFQRWYLHLQRKVDPLNDR